MQTIFAANCPRPDGSGFDCLITVGLMDGTVFREILRALESEAPAFGRARAPDALGVLFDRERAACAHPRLQLWALQRRCNSGCNRLGCRRRVGEGGAS